MGASRAATPAHRHDLRLIAGRGGFALGLVAVAVHLLLPLVVVCRTYRTLAPERPSCCRPAGGPDGAGPKVGAARAVAPARAPCPYCSARSPFQHARFQAKGSYLVGAPRLDFGVPSLVSAALPPASPTPGQPRAPPLAS